MTKDLQCCWTVFDKVFDRRSQRFPPTATTRSVTWSPMPWRRLARTESSQSKMERHYTMRWRWSRAWSSTEDSSRHTLSTQAKVGQFIFDLNPKSTLLSIKWASFCRIIFYRRLHVRQSLRYWRDPMLLFLFIWLNTVGIQNTTIAKLDFLCPVFEWLAIWKLDIFNWFSNALWKLDHFGTDLLWTIKKLNMSGIE